MSILDIQIDQAEKDREMVIKKYVAVSDQLRVTIQPDQIPPLQLLREQLAEQSRRIEAELITLRSQRPGSIVKAPAGPPVELAAQTRHALLIGIDKYAGFRDLEVCSEDAEAIRTSLENRGYSRIEKITDQDNPDRDSVINKIQDLAATESDLLLFYFSGHGATAGDESYLVMPQSKPSNLKTSGIPLSMLKQTLTGSKARSKVIILDCCHSGVGFASKGEEEDSLNLQYINHLYSEAKGWVVLASSEQTQVSWTWGENKRSVFTYFLLEALEGNADFQKFGFVSALNTYSYVEPRVREWSIQNQKKLQTPTISTESAGDIVLAVY